MLAIADAGPLYASVDHSDDDHLFIAELFELPDLQLIIPAMVVAEVTCMIGRRLGPLVEARFLAGLADMMVVAPDPDDWPHIAALAAQYADFPLGGTDTSVIALAERLGTDLVVTFDHRHFRAVKPRHCDAFRLLPDDR